MNEYIGYIRVSTVKQGTQGVSLDEQRDGIMRYSQRSNLPVGLWLKEMVTAAKEGRPMFKQALKLLGQRKYRGIILHKLDRGARNLHDWLALADLADEGIEVHFVNESLDLSSRGGRLSADIQAVVSADYIRNLKEETRKGFYGRLKQGFYPLDAPNGYLNHGKAKPKTIDSVAAPFVRQTFELYATGNYNFETLEREMYRRGLRNRNGGRVTKNGLSLMFNNPFYMGLIRIKKTGEVFAGNHEPLIPKSLFDRVQAVLHGRTNTQSQRHCPLFRRLLTCATCGYSLVGERQKGHTYYRCHTKSCPVTCIREEALQRGFDELLKSLCFTENELKYFKMKILEIRTNWASKQEEFNKNLRLRLGQTKDRLLRLTDAFLDGSVDKTVFDQRKEALLLEQKDFEEQLTNLGHQLTPWPDRLEKFLELAGNALLSHEFASPDEKREMVKIFTSNRMVNGKNLYLEPSIPFRDIAERSKKTSCDPQQDIPRTWDRLLNVLTTLNTNGLLPDFSTAPIFNKDHSNEEITLKE